jgi:[acyl-carrier-protein] S-malonyltransferase
MASAATKLEATLNGTQIQQPCVPVISNVTAKPHEGADAIRSTLVKQVTASVYWEDSMHYLIAEGFTRFIELGPGTTLSGFLKRIDKTMEVLNVADSESLEKTVAAITQK